jgi:tetratricopeptide (TPR) repeat protein
MKNRLKIVIIVIGLAVIGFVGWQWASDGELISGDEYPGFVNQEDLDIPDSARLQWEAQLDTARASLAQDPDNFGQLQATAVLEQQLGLYADARKHMELLLKGNQINPVAWTIYGDIVYKMRDYETAELAYAKSLELDIDQQVLLKLENVWRNDLPSQYPNIETLYKDAISAAGQEPFFLIRLAQWYADEGRYEEAASHLKVAMDLDPENEDIRTDYENMKEKARGQ